MATNGPCDTVLCLDGCPHVNHPSRSVLQKPFITYVTIANEELFFCGNGPNILVGTYNLSTYEFGKLNVPCDFTEIAVFPQLQIPVRGIIPMPQEKFILAFGANFLAIIGHEQLMDGGQLCQSRVISTHAIVVGGRRLGANKFQVFYEDGGYETLDMTKKKRKHKKYMAIGHGSAKKLELKGAKVTSLVVCGSEVLLGTSRGQVVSHLGKVYLRADEAKGAVRQMTVMNEHILLLLFHNKAIALLDTSLHGLRSVIEGRFTAVESVFTKDFIVAGDLDGTLHCFGISPKGTLIRLLNSSKCIFRDAIVSMFPIQNASLVCTTAMGSMFVVNRAGLVDATAFASNVNSGSMVVRTSSDIWYFLKEKRLYTVAGTFSSNLQATEVCNVALTRQLKYYRMNDFEIVYAFGHNMIYIDFKNKHGHHTVCNIEEHHKITNVVATVDHILVQQGSELKIYALRRPVKCVATATVVEYSKATAFSKILKSATSTVFVIALQDGRLYFGKGNSASKSAQPMSLVLITTLHKDFMVSMQPARDDGLFMLSAKARLMTYILLPSKYKKTPANEYFKVPVPTYDVYFQLDKSLSYKHALGRGYDILIIDNCLYLVGFKQRTLNVYKVGDHQVLSVPSEGPRSSYLIFEDSKSSIRVVCDLGVGVISRTFPKTGRIKVIDMRHCATISHILSICKTSCGDCDCCGAIVTGDCNGMVALMSCTRGLCGSKLRPRCSHQLNGAIRAMYRNESNVFVGTSTGHFVVFRLLNGRFYPIFDYNFGVAVTNIQGAMLTLSAGEPDPEGHSEGALIMLADESRDAVCCPRDRPPYLFGRTSTEKRGLKNLKLCGMHVSVFSSAVHSLSNDGVLYVDTGIYGDIYKNSIDVNPPQRYSFFKSIHIGKEAERRWINAYAAGYYSGLFLFAVYEEEAKGYRYFTADWIHKHEIIDFFFHRDPSKTTAGVWIVSTLDKAGLYVQRTLLSSSNCIKLHGLPLKWHSQVRHPKAMTLLEKSKEVIVVGQGLDTIPMKSLPPPPSPAD